MQMLLLLGLATLAAATTNEDSWSEGNDITQTVPKLIELKIKHTSSPLFIQSAASNGVTKLGFDATKFVELQNKAHDAQGQEFTVDNFLGVDGAENKPLSLKAFEVFAEDAKLVMANEDGTDTEIEKPNMLHLRGSISGDPSSLVLLHMSTKASFGLVQSDQHHLSIEADPEAEGHSLLIEASSFKLDEKQKMEEFAAEQEAAVPDELFIPKVTIKKPTTLFKATEEELAQTRVGTGYSIGIAIDCDQACVARLNQFAPASGQGTDATSYLTALIAGTSAVYERDLGRALSITFLRLWDRASPFDSGTNSLTAYRAEWQTNPGTQTYDVAHLMTGIQEGGVAYVGTVCRRGPNVGVSSLRGQWQGATSGSTAYMWDLEVTAHELGHNFGSGHSHDYNPPIDECVSCRAGFSASQCQSGGSAVGPVPRNDARCVKGTVMSYCHLCGGMTNINMNFHPRAIERIQGVLNSNCGAAGPAPPPTPPGVTRGPTTAPPPTPPPTYAPGTCRDQSSACNSYGTQYCPSQTSSTVTINNQPYNDYCCATCNGASGGSAPTPAPPTTAPATTRRRAPTTASSGGDSCRYQSDGECDEPTYCSAGTDTTDCSSGGSPTPAPPTPAPAPPPTRAPASGSCNEPNFCSGWSQYCGRGYNTGGQPVDTVCCSTCGSAPSPATPAPAPSSSSGGSSGCVADGSLANCQPCQYSAQCAATAAVGGFCCPFMKLCVESSTFGCGGTIANCRPTCGEWMSGYPDSCTSCSDYTWKGVNSC